MVDLQANNAKLRERAVRLTVHVSGADAAAARAALAQCHYQVKTAIVMLLKNQSPVAAQALLAHNHGNLRAALK
jgi:N-acetylmuramic acid 6-phosphate etherase